MDDKINQSKAQYIYIYIYRKTAKISQFPSRNVGKYEFLTGEYVLPEK